MLSHKIAKEIPNLTKIIGKTESKQMFLKNLKPELNDNNKCLKISIIGLPNSGKSCLVNSLMEWRVSSVSSKVHTTRKNILSNYTDRETQLIFYDTPGLVDKSQCLKHALELDMTTSPHTAVNQTDIVGVVVDVSNMWTRHRFDRLTLDILKNNISKPSILILNKIDQIKRKSYLLDIIRSLTNNMFRGKMMPGVILKHDNSHPINLHGSEDGEENSFDQGLINGKRNDDDDDRPTNILHNLEALEDYRFKTYMSSRKLHKEERDFSGNGSTAVSKDKKMPHSIENSLVYSNFSKVQIPVYVNQEEDKEAMDDLRHQTKLAKMLDRESRTWPNFEEVFMVSALQNDGINDIRDYLLSQAPKSPWEFNSNFITDQKPKDIVIDAIRQELLDELKFQIPYILKIKIDEYFIDSDGLFRIIASIHCPKENLVKILIGPKGERIKKINDRVSQNLMNTFRTDLFLSLAIKCVKESS